MSDVESANMSHGSMKSVASIQELRQESGVKLELETTCYIGDRGREGRLVGPPSRQTVRADLPHTAFQSVVFTLSRTDGPEHGLGSS